jgi:hypothetical protein
VGKCGGRFTPPPIFGVQVVVPFSLTPDISYQTAARMDPEPSEVVVPVRPKTTHVRMGRQRPTADDEATADDPVAIL